MLSKHVECVHFFHDFSPSFLFYFLYSEGSNLTPAHHYSDFRFKTYAPIAFRYFRELFGIRPDDYLVSQQNNCCTTSVCFYLNYSHIYPFVFLSLLCWSTHSVMSHLLSCPTLEPVAQSSTSLVMMSSSLKQSNTKRQSSSRNSCLDTSWWGFNVMSGRIKLVGALMRSAECGGGLICLMILLLFRI